MMSNERQRQESTPVVVAKDNLKSKKKQKVTLCKTKRTNKIRIIIIIIIIIILTLNGLTPLPPTMDGWKNEIKNDGWWLMKRET